MRMRTRGPEVAASVAPPSHEDAGREKTRVVGVTKIFGRTPARALELVREGRSKEDVLRETGDVVALHDVSFSVAEGEVFIVMGLSGSGKSTLVRCLNRLVVPTAGRIFIDDDEITALPEEQLRELRRRKITMVFQHFALFPHKTVLDNVAFGLKVQGLKRAEREARAHEALELVGLGGWERRYPRSLSGGMQQRVGLARALATEPDVLLMDEPFSALDPVIRGDMQQELLELQQRVKKTIVFITHDLAEALRLGDRVAIMRDGAVVQLGTPEEIVAAPADAYVAHFVQEVDRSQVFRVRTIARPAPTLPAGASVAAAAALVERDGRVFIVDDGKRPLGALGEHEIARALRDGFEVADDVMADRLSRLAADATLGDVFAECALGLPLAVVADDGRLVGTLEQSDVLRALAKRPEMEGSRDA
jgi:glycine betaine/proline transport system ATP-binding protein